MSTRTVSYCLAAFTTIAVLAAPTPAQQQPRPARPGGLGQNAALRYWQAFAHLPRLDEQQQKLLSAAGATDGSPPDPAAAEIVQSGKDALLYLHRGAAIGPCDWGLHREDGPYLLLPHLAKGRDLGRLACLSARVDFAKGENARGVEAAGDTLVLARHLSTDLTAIISYLVQLNVEGAAINTLAPHLGALDPAALDALDRRLAALPPGGSIQACLKVERESFLDWAIAELRGMNDQDPWKERVLAPLAMGESETPDKNKMDAAVQASGGTRQGLLKQFESLRAYYDEVGAIVTLPREQFRSKLADIEKRTEANPMARSVIPTMGKVYDKDAAGRTRMTLLKAAIAVVRGGPEKARDFKDASGAAVEYQAAGDSFELRTKVVDEDKPVTLKVGGKNG
jgi:hypothetical protein